MLHSVVVVVVATVVVVVLVVDEVEGQIGTAPHCAVTVVPSGH